MSFRTQRTLRSRATWTCARGDGWEFLLEGDHVSYISSENFNNMGKGRTDYPAMAAPDYSEVNRARLSYALPEGPLTMGRQRIDCEDQRFIGGRASPTSS